MSEILPFLSRRSLGIAVITTLALNAHAQIRPDAGSALQQPAPRIEPGDVRPVLPRITPTPEPESQSTAKVFVKRFKFSGNTLIATDVLAAQVAEFTDRELTINELRVATERIRDHYRREGYFLAQAYMPRQEVAAGEIEIAILEGRLGNLTIKREPGVRIRGSFLRGILDAHAPKGAPLMERNLERPLLIIGGLPNTRAAAALTPGGETGAADIEVEVRAAPRGWLERQTDGLLSGSADLDNYGNRFTGEHRIGVNLQATSLTGYGDVLSARLQKTNDHKTDLTRLGWSTPIGYYGTTLGIGYSHFDYGLGKQFAPLHAGGEGDTFNLVVSHPLLRTRPINLYLRAGAEHKRLEDRIRSTSSVDDRTVRLGFIGLSFDSRDHGGLSAGSLTWNRGRVSFDTPGLLTADITPGGLNVNGHFSRVNAELQRLQPLTPKLSLYGVVAGQAASKNLSSSEKLSLGGPNAVRAYPVGEGAGDEGILATAEVRYSPGMRIAGGDLGLAAFFDYGYVRVLKNAPIGGVLNDTNKHSVSGAGVGFNLGSDGNFLLRANVAWRLSNRAPASDTVGRHPRVWIHAIQWF